MIMKSSLPYRCGNVPVNAFAVVLVIAARIVGVFALASRARTFFEAARCWAGALPARLPQCGLSSQVMLYRRDGRMRRFGGSLAQSGLRGSFSVTLAFLIAGTLGTSALAAIPGAVTLSEAIPSNRSVTLKWADQENSEIDSFEYSYHTGDGIFTQWTTIENSTATTTEHTVGELNNETTYTFRVQARTADGVGGAANELSATPDVVPPRPTYFGAIISKNKSVQIIFQASSYNHITGWELRRKKKGEEYGAWTSIRVDTYIVRYRSHTVGSLENDTTYVFQIRGVHGEVKGPASEEKESTPHSQPGAPADFKATPFDSKVRLSWTNPRNPHIYGWQYRQGSGSWAAVPRSNGNTTSFEVSGLRNDSTYTFRLRGITRGHIGRETSAVSVTPRAKPPKPTIVVVPGDGKLTVTASATSYEHIVSWQQRYKTSSDANYGSWAALTVTGSGNDDRQGEISGLTNDSTYMVQIRADNQGVSGDASEEAEATPHAKPGALAGFTVTPKAGKVTLSWTNPNNANITKYQYEQDGDGNWKDLTLTSAEGATTMEADVSGLTNGTQYSFKIRGGHVCSRRRRDQAIHGDTECRASQADDCRDRSRQREIGGHRQSDVLRAHCLMAATLQDQQ